MSDGKWEVLCNQPDFNAQVKYEPRKIAGRATLELVAVPNVQFGKLFAEPDLLVKYGCDTWSKVTKSPISATAGYMSFVMQKTLLFEREYVCAYNIVTNSALEFAIQFVDVTDAEFEKHRMTRFPRSRVIGAQHYSAHYKGHNQWKVSCDACVDIDIPKFLFDLFAKNGLVSWKQDVYNFVQDEHERIAKEQDRKRLSTSLKK